MLEGKSVILTPVDPENIAAQHVAWLNDPETFRYLGTKFAQTSQTVRRYVEALQYPNMICRIIDKSTREYVGNVALNSYQPIHRRMEIGIVIGEPSARGRGLGTAACSLLIQYAFDHLNLHKVTAGTVDGNVAMKRAFLSLGFRIEGTLIQDYFVEGQYRDTLRFGLLRDEFRPRH